MGKTREKLEKKYIKICFFLTFFLNEGKVFVPFSDFLCYNFFFGKIHGVFIIIDGKRIFIICTYFCRRYTFFVPILWPINKEEKDKRKMVLQLSTPFFFHQAFLLVLVEGFRLIRITFILFCGNGLKRPNGVYG